MGVGIEIDVWQIIKDLGAAVDSLKDRKLQGEINTLVGRLTREIRDREAKLLELQSENNKLIQIAPLTFTPGKNYLIDEKYPDRHFCPVCTKKNNVLVPLDDDEQCQYCNKEWE